MGKGFGLGLCAGRGGESCLRLGRGFSVGKEVDFIGYGASKVIEGLADIGWVVIGLI